MVSNQTDFKPSSSTPRGCSQINTKIDLQPQILRAAWLPGSEWPAFLSFVLGASKRKTLRVLSHLFISLPWLYVSRTVWYIGVAVWRGGRRQALESYNQDPSFAVSGWGTWWNSPNFLKSLIPHLWHSHITSLMKANKCIVSTCL